METTLNFTGPGTKVFSMRWLYKLGAVAALMAMAANILDIALGFGGSEMITYGSRSAVEWYGVYQESWFTGVYGLGILNIVYMAAMLPVYFALSAAHLKGQAMAAALTTVLFVTAISIYISNNAAIPLLVLSGKYSMAGSELERSLLAAAGEAILSRGEDFTAGSFIAIFLSSAAAICISVVMLRGGIFGKVNAWVGIVGFSFLSLFTIMATFIPALYEAAFNYLASIGGILALTWFALTARRLFRVASMEKA